jgi:hypothetical protein
VKNILIPAFIANGFSPPWPSPSADPDNPASAFRGYLDHSMNAILAAGYTVTNDLTHIDIVAALPGDSNCDGAVNAFDIDPFILALVDPVAYQAAFPNCNILNADCSFDGVVNPFDIDPFIARLTGK